MLATYLQVVLSGLAVGGIYALIALSFSITFTTTKTLNFAQGVFIGIGAFLGVASLAILSGRGLFASLGPDASTGMTYTTTAIAVGVAMGVVGLLLFVTAVRPFAGKPGMSWVMSTIGFGIILQNLGLAIWGPAPVNLPPPDTARDSVQRREEWKWAGGRKRPSPDMQGDEQGSYVRTSRDVFESANWNRTTYGNWTTAMFFPINNCLLETMYNCNARHTVDMKRSFDGSLIRCLVPGSRDAILTREGEEALWPAVFTVQPGQR